MENISLPWTMRVAPFQKWFYWILITIMLILAMIIWKQRSFVFDEKSAIFAFSIIFFIFTGLQILFQEVICRPEGLGYVKIFFTDKYLGWDEITNVKITHRTSDYFFRLPLIEVHKNGKKYFDLPIIAFNKKDILIFVSLLNKNASNAEIDEKLKRAKVGSEPINW